MEINNLEWSWCWDCDAPTIWVGKENICCAAWYEVPGLLRMAIDFSKDNPAPNSPTLAEIDAKLNCDNYTKEDISICQTFHSFSYGNFYWLPKHWADKIGYTIPTYEELCEKYGFKPEYDCKTGKQWSIDENKSVYDKEGWVSLENFEQEEIPYREFCTRRRISKIRYEKKLKQ